MTSPPLQCSVSCGQGYRQRLISCSEVHGENENYEYGHQSLSNCPGTPPESYMPCHLDPCPSPQAWRVGIWGPVCVSRSSAFCTWSPCSPGRMDFWSKNGVIRSNLCAVFTLQCSASCGEGVMERRVQCLVDGQESQGCPQDDKPEGRKVCRNPSCEFRPCLTPDAISVHPYVFAFRCAHLKSPSLLGPFVFRSFASQLSGSAEHTRPLLRWRACSKCSRKST